MKITYLGHNTLWIETQNSKIMVDPFISGNELANNIKVTDYYPDYILLTHAHQDHILDVDTLATLGNSQIISNFEIVSYFDKKGFRGHGMNTGGSAKFPFGKLSSVVAHHSSQFPDGTYGGNPNGYVLQSNNKTIYIAGDTALTMDMKLIPRLFGKLDLAILPIGDNFTMDAEAAVIAADFVECNQILGCHYDTFPPIKINHDDVKKTFTQAGKQLILLPIGDSIEI
ncbi:MAG: metal-dependent hydrolase [Flavobacteriaceae bacterium]|nr:metal-dependent hydrolase [Flavobacteriaceae bacterium]